jgi:hypothetical protein
MGSSFDNYIVNKVKPVEGDMLKENIGLSAESLAEIT